MQGTFLFSFSQTAVACLYSIYKFVNDCTVFLKRALVSKKYSGIKVNPGKVKCPWCDMFKSATSQRLVDVKKVVVENQKGQVIVTNNIVIYLAISHKNI